MKHIIRIVLSFATLGLGVYVGLYILPYHFSGQKPIDESKLSGLYDPDYKTGGFHGKTVTSIYIPPSLVYFPNVLGAYRADKRIEIDLSNQHLYAFEGDNKIYDFAVSTGKWGKTPIGEFHIWTKVRYTKMEGGNRAWNTYYYLPNVPFTMFFANDQIPTSRGYGIHGTYWHNNFGHPMSHGCVNMKTEEAEKLYYWAQPDLPEGKSSARATADNPGTRVVIYGTAPKE